MQSADFCQETDSHLIGTETTRGAGLNKGAFYFLKYFLGRSLRVWPSETVFTGSDTHTATDHHSHTDTDT